MKSRQFYLGGDAQVKFGLRESKKGAWDSAITQVRRVWKDLLRQQTTTVVGEWIAVFEDHVTPTQMLVCQTAEDYQPRLGTGVHTIPLGIPAYEVCLQLACLASIPFSARLSSSRYNKRGDDLVQELVGCLKCVRVVQVKRGPKKSIILLFYGKTQTLEWDPDRYEWPEEVHFMYFTTQSGRKILFKRHVIPAVVQKKWTGILPDTFKLRWLNAWDKEREKKEAGLLWAVGTKGWRSMHGMAESKPAGSMLHDLQEWYQGDCSTLLLGMSRSPSSLAFVCIASSTAECSGSNQCRELCLFNQHSSILHYGAEARRPPGTPSARRAHSARGADGAPNSHSPPPTVGPAIVSTT